MSSNICSISPEDWHNSSEYRIIIRCGTFHVPSCPKKKKQYHNTGDNTEKIWAHQFLTKPKGIAAGGMVVGGSREMPWWGQSPQFFILFV